MRRDDSRTSGPWLPGSLAACCLGVLLSGTAAAQDAADRYPGTAVVRVGEDEYTLPLECTDPARPELGFITEPQRLTRERTGRASMVRVRAEPSDRPDELVLWLDRYVTWISTGGSVGGTLSITTDMGPVTVVKDQLPVLVTREMWASGEQPTGLEGVVIDAGCGFLDPEAPAYRKVPGEGGTPP